jgi:hypothetical protein
MAAFAFEQDSRPHSEFGTSIPKDISKDLTPCSLAIVKLIQYNYTYPPFQALFDSGLDSTFIHKQCLPCGSIATTVNTKTGQTLAGQLTTPRQFELYEIILPKFSRSSRVDHQTAYVFTGICDYDITFGQDFLRIVDMTQDFAKGTMTAFGSSVNMKHKSYYNKDPIQALSVITDLRRRN